MEDTNSPESQTVSEGPPSFLVGGELWFGKDRLRDVEEEIVRVAST